METKPYSLQSPEQIAKDYGGNKQRIAEAMQMGIVDPTAGTMAGMFIDRMRAAQQQEMAPQPTVAQQVFAPPAPPMGAAPIPAGLGATPQAAAMAAAAPQMMAPPPPPMGAPGMAAGGLTTLPLPDAMFDEPDVGGYASGGLVAFQTGGAVDDEYPSEDIVVTGRRTGPPQEISELAGPREYYGNFRYPYLMQERIRELAPQSTARRDQLSTYFDRLLSPEAQRNRRREDMFMTLGQIGARMASTPGSLLQAVSAGIGEALPGVRTAAAERRAEERNAISELARIEGLSNADAREMYRLIQEGTNRYGQFHQGDLSRAQQRELEILKEKGATERTRLAASAGITEQQIAASAQRDVGGLEFRARRAAIFDNVYSNLRQNAALDPEYQRLFEVNPNSADRYLRNLAAQEVDRQFGGGSVNLGRY